MASKLNGLGWVDMLGPPDTLLEVISCELF